MEEDLHQDSISKDKSDTKTESEMMTERMKTSGQACLVYICKVLDHYTIYIQTYMYVFFDQMTYDILLFSPSSDFMSPRENFKASQKLKCNPYSLIALLLPPKIYA